jgi:hypothetical protein
VNCGIAIVAAGLSGCAYVQTDVRVSGAAEPFEAGRTYELARTSPQAADPAHERYESRVREELAGYGFVEASPDPAHHPQYLVSIAYDTHPVSVSVKEGDCGSAGARAAGDTDTPGCLPVEARRATGHGHYEHSLTLRFFDWAAGREIYKVSTTERNGDEDAAGATPYLVKSALARFPYAGYPDWRVKLRAAGASGLPDVVSVTPLTK